MPEHLERNRQMRRKIGLWAAMAALGMFATATNAMVLSWEFDVDPDKEPVPMTKVGNGYGWGGGLAG